MIFNICIVFYKLYDTFYKNNYWSFMNYNKLLKFSSLFLSLTLVGCGALNDSQTHHSKAKTVEVAQTEVRDQGRVGFCWAYATTAFVEAKHLKETGEALTLSPEALGFYRMAIGLHQATRAKSAQDLMALVMPGGLEGYFVKLPDGGSDALSIINQFGLVPESHWSFKFSGDGQSEKMMAAMRSGLWVVVRDRLLRGRDASDLTLDEVIEKVMTVRGAYPSRPPVQFEWNGKTISSQSFARDIVSFKSEDYYSFEVNSSSALDKMIQLSKKALTLGISVPFAYPVNASLMKAELFSGEGADSQTDFAKDGAHAVLVTDYVNIGGREGAMSELETSQELSKSSTELSYLKFKNSWGKNAKKNESGVVIAGSETGYYKIDYAYLRGVANQIDRDPGLSRVFSVMLPINLR